MSVKSILAGQHLKKKKSEQPQGKPMSCPVCKECYELLTDTGRPTGVCVFGGPYLGYKEES